MYTQHTVRHRSHYLAVRALTSHSFPLHMHACIYMCVCECVYICADAYVYIYVYIYISTHRFLLHSSRGAKRGISSKCSDPTKRSDLRKHRSPNSEALYSFVRLALIMVRCSTKPVLIIKAPMHFPPGTGKLVWKEVTPRPPNNAPAVGKLMPLVWQEQMLCLEVHVLGWLQDDVHQAAQLKPLARFFLFRTVAGCGPATSMHDTG